MSGNEFSGYKLRTFKCRRTISQARSHPYGAPIKISVNPAVRPSVRPSVRNNSRTAKHIKKSRASQISLSSTSH